MIVELRMVPIRDDGQWAVCMKAFPVPNDRNSKGAILEATESCFKSKKAAQEFIDREAKEKGPWSVEKVALRMEKRSQ